MLFALEFSKFESYGRFNNSAIGVYLGLLTMIITIAAFILLLRKETFLADKSNREGVNINTLFLYSVFKPALCVSAIYAAAMGYTRLAAGAHYLTDVAAAAIIGYTAFLTAGAIYIKLSAKI